MPQPEIEVGPADAPSPGNDAFSWPCRVVQHHTATGRDIIE